MNRQLHLRCVQDPVVTDLTDTLLRATYKLSSQHSRPHPLETQATDPPSARQLGRKFMPASKVDSGHHSLFTNEEKPGF